MVWADEAARRHRPRRGRAHGPGERPWLTDRGDGSRRACRQRRLRPRRPVGRAPAPGRSRPEHRALRGRRRPRRRHRHPLSAAVTRRGRRGPRGAGRLRAEDDQADCRPHDDEADPDGGLGEDGSTVGAVEGVDDPVVRGVVEPAPAAPRGLPPPRPRREAEHDGGRAGRHAQDRLLPTVEPHAADSTSGPGPGRRTSVDEEAAALRFFEHPARTAGGEEHRLDLDRVDRAWPPPKRRDAAGMIRSGSVRRSSRARPMAPTVRSLATVSAGAGPMESTRWRGTSSESVSAIWSTTTTPAGTNTNQRCERRCRMRTPRTATSQPTTRATPPAIHWWAPSSIGPATTPTTTRIQVSSIGPRSSTPGGRSGMRRSSP